MDVFEEGVKQAVKKGFDDLFERGRERFPLPEQDVIPYSTFVELQN
jgi:hypothetical protein